MNTKNRVALLIAVATASMAMTSIAQSLTDPPQGFGFIGGYHPLNLKNTTFAHRDNPGDPFLSGGAGTTSVDGISHFAFLGFRYQTPPFGKNWSLNFDVGGLMGGRRDDHQNADDPRPAANGSFVYSEDHFGVLGGVGLSYNLNRWSLGVQAEADGIFIDNGWDRFNQDQSEKKRLDWLFSVGPKVGYRFTENVSGEVGVLVGPKTVVGIINVCYWFGKI